MFCCPIWEGAVSCHPVVPRIIQVTHRLDELEWADSASYMDGGAIRVSGSVGRIRRHLRSLGARV